MGDRMYMVFMSKEKVTAVRGDPSVEEGFLMFRDDGGKITASFSPGHWAAFVPAS